ncbi:MAG: DUF2007 domain-containing protein [Bacteroidia bacterium]|nr:DUF2007 domain-containing protein [Bacteroidia bacterium]
MSEKLVTLVTYTYNTETYLLVAKLEAEGIKSFIKNEHTLSTQQFLSNAVGGLDVQVFEKDLAHAKIVLKKMEEETKTVVPEELKTGFEKVLVYCPECESTNVYKKKGFVLFGGREHVCADCKYSWKQ